MLQPVTVLLFLSLCTSEENLALFSLKQAHHHHHFKQGEKQRLHPALASPSWTNPSLWASSCAPATLVVFHWTSHTLSVSFVPQGSLKARQCFRCSFTSAGQMVLTPSPDPLAVLLLMQPGVQVSLCQWKRVLLTHAHLSSRTHVDLFCPRCETVHLSLLN